jgi:hypothetical protein
MGCFVLHCSCQSSFYSWLLLLVQCNAPNALVLSGTQVEGRPSTQVHTLDGMLDQCSCCFEVITAVL